MGDGVTVYTDDRQTMEALQTLIAHPVHREAKAGQAEWLDGYHVVVAQVVASHGDGGIGHALAGTADRRA